MAASVILYTPGSGGKAHGESATIGANTGDFPYVLEAEHQRASYLAVPETTGPVSIATANSHVFQIMAGSSLRVYLRRLEIYQNALATTAALCAVLLVRLTTAGTGGTANGRAALDPADGAAGATVMTLPTVKGTEGAISWMGTMYLAQTAAASTPLSQPILTIDFDRPRSKAAIIAAGTANGIAFKNQTAIAAASVTYSLWFDELNF